MSDTTQAPVTPAPSGHFDGREWIEAAPAGESPSPVAGNDDGGAPSADEAAPSAPVEGDGEDRTVEVRSGEGEADGGDDAPAARGTFWAQTPEEKREERFNNALERSNALAKEVREYKEKLAKYEAGEGPKPKEPEAPETVSASPTEANTDPNALINAALDPKLDPEKLTDSQKQIRRLSLEVTNTYQELVPKAKAAREEAAKTVGTIKAQIARKNQAIEDFKERNSAAGREGLYDAEIQELEAAVRGLDQNLTKAQIAHNEARQDERDGLEAYREKLKANQAKALRIAGEEGRRHQEAASQATAEAEHQAEVGRYEKAWDESIKAVLDELKIPTKLRKGAAAQAFLDVQALGIERQKQGKPVLPTEFRKLIAESIKADIGEYAEEDAGAADAHAADTRAAATASHVPKKRVASGNGDAKPMSKDEAWAAVSAVSRSSRLRPAS